MYTFESAHRLLDAMPDGDAKIAANSKLYEAENAAHARIQESSLRYAVEAIEGISEADRLTESHTQAVTDAMEKLRTGTMNAADAAELFDKVVRRQTEFNAKVSAWRAGAVRSVEHYGDPIKRHDELVRNYPELKTRPVVSF